MRWISWLVVVLASGCVTTAALRPVETVRADAAERLGCEDDAVQVVRLGTSPYDAQNTDRVTYAARGCGRMTYFLCDSAGTDGGECEHRAEPPYRTPSPEQPHAIVKYQGVYHGHGVPEATGLLETIRVEHDGYLLRETDVPASPTIAIPVGTVERRWRVEARAKTRETELTYTYDTTCYGDYCFSGLKPQMRTTESTHGSCVAQFRLRPRAGETYRVRYEFWGLDRCTVHCSREVRDGRGATRGVPCTEMTLELAEGTTG